MNSKEEIILVTALNILSRGSVVTLAVTVLGKVGGLVVVVAIVFSGNFFLFDWY